MFIKVLSICGLALSGLILGDLNTLPDHLTEAQYWHLGIGIFKMLITIIIGIVIFRSVWIRKGYEGVNEQLELHETKAFITHVIGFLCFLEIQHLDTIEPLLNHKYSEMRYWLVGSGFLGSGLFSVLQYAKKLRSKDE